MRSLLTTLRHFEVLSRRRIRPVFAAFLAVAGLVATLGAVSGSASGTPLTPVGPLRIETTGAGWQTDPALAYFSPAWEQEYATCAMLVNYPDAPRPRDRVSCPRSRQECQRSPRTGASTRSRSATTTPSRRLRAAS